MSFTAREGRIQLLGELGQAVHELAVAVACLAEAYELVDEGLADTLERRLFGPTQAAYARARRAQMEFASRVGLSDVPGAPASSGTHSADPRDYLQRGLESVERADALIAELQDSMLPVEVGDRELRDGLSESRSLIAEVPGRTRELLRTVGR